MHYITLDSAISFKANKHFKIYKNRQLNVDGLKSSLHLVAALNENWWSLSCLSFCCVVHCTGRPVRLVTFGWTPLLRK